MLVNILRFVRGTVTFEVRGDFAERFLNLLGRNGIPVFYTQWSDGGFVAQTTVKSYFRIRPYVRRTHVRVRVVKRQGLPFLMRRYSKRMGLIVGIALFILCINLSGGFVWEIQLNGNHLVPDDDILQTLEEGGLVRGSWKKSLNVNDLAMRLREAYPQIIWSAVNLVGSVAEVEISEQAEVEQPESTDPCNVVASRAGQIVRMEVYDGQAVLQKGDAVQKGQLVVSGVVKSTKGITILRHASAQVLVEYSEQKTVTVPLTQTLKVPDSGMVNLRYLNLGKLRIPLFLAGGKPQLCFERVFERPVRLFGITLPFDLTIHQVIPATQQTVTLTAEKAAQLAESELLSFERQTPERTVVSRKIKSSVRDNQLVMTAEYVFQEDAAQQEEILLNGQ